MNFIQVWGFCQSPFQWVFVAGNPLQPTVVAEATTIPSSAQHVAGGPETTAIEAHQQRSAVSKVRKYQSPTRGRSKKTRSRKIISRDGSVEKRKQERKALTNVGNQLLTFISVRRKDTSKILCLFPNFKESQLARYYCFAKSLKRSMYSYVTLKKLQSIWNAVPETEEEDLYYRIIRQLSRYYIREMLVLGVITSKRIASNARLLHLKIGRRLLLELASQ